MAVIKDDPEVLALYRAEMVEKRGGYRPKVESIADIISNKTKVQAGTSRAYSIARVQRGCDAVFVNRVDTSPLGTMSRIPPIAFEAPNNSGERPQRIESYEPDMAAIIDGPEEEKLDDMTADIAVAGAVLNEILQYVIGERSVEIHFPSAFRKFVSVIWVLRPEMLHEASLSQLAPQLSVTRQALSKAARRFADRHGGLRNRLMRSEETRRKCSAAQRANHWRRRRKPEGDHSGQAIKRPTRAS